MKIAGRRIAIAGSAAPDVPIDLLNYAHDLIGQLVHRLFAKGALFEIAVGREPRWQDDPAQPSIIFDWNVLEKLGAELKANPSKASTPQGKLIATVTTDKTASQVPDPRKPLWTDLLNSGGTFIRSVEPGWTSGAIRRQLHAELADVLIILSGGEGVEHLAREFALQEKPVIPLDLQLGASSADGTGGAAKLFGQMRAHPARFASFNDPTSAGALLAGIETRKGTVPTATVADGVIKLIEALKPPKAFYVRLLNTSVPEYAEVERYFREVVDPVVTDFGYEPTQMGRSPSTSAWMDLQIFEMIHNAGLVIVDLTGMRPNCFTEMGYAFGRSRKTIVTAMEGTKIPFDTNAYEAALWQPAKSAAEKIDELKQYWRRNSNRPALVTPKSIL